MINRPAGSFAYRISGRRTSSGWTAFMRLRFNLYNARELLGSCVGLFASTNNATGPLITRSGVVN